MMNATSWGSLEVEKFFRDYNWLGKPVQLQFTETGQTNKEKSSWLCLNVEEYFLRNNWRGQSIVKRIDQVDYSTLSLTMPVGEFFQLATWRNLSIANEVSKSQSGTSSRPQSKPQPAPLDSQEYNLSDLSDLF